MKLIMGMLLSHKLYAWKYVKTDGIMINSYELLITKKSIINDIVKMSIRRLLDLDNKIMIFIDSGGFQYLKHNRSVKLERLIDLYLKIISVNDDNIFLVSLDLPPIPHDNLRNRNKKITKTISNYRQLLRSLSKSDIDIRKIIPVIHLTTNKVLLQKQIESYGDAEIVGIGGLVPYVLRRGPKDSRLIAFAFIHLVKRMLKEYIGHEKVHVFGLGAPSVIPFLRVLGVYSTDSMTWRVKAAYGKIILPGCGERHVTDRVVNFGKRKLSPDEYERLLKLLDEFNRVSREKISFDDLRRDFTKRAIFNFWVLNMHAHNHDGFMVPRIFRKLMVRVKEIMELSDDEILEFIASRFKH